MADLCSVALALLYGSSPGYNLTSTDQGFLPNSSPEFNISTRFHRNDTEIPTADYDRTYEAIRFYLAHVVNPIFCVFGLIGNVFNVLVLSRRRMKMTMACTMEKGAHAGLIALAISDELYCACALLDALISRPHSIFSRHSPSLYMRMYGKYLQNTFARTGTWLTVIMAAGRYAAICRPIQARYLLGVNSTRFAVMITFIFWIFITLPMAWTHEAVELDCGPQFNLIILDLGKFITVLDGKLKISFSYIWAALGLFIPMILLIYFTYHLIRALQESSRMRSFYRVNPKVSSSGNRITITLIAIVISLLVLVTPAELIQFYYYGIRKDKVESFTLLIVITNVLQTVNFSVNFVLYCIVNVHFRETWKELISCGICRASNRRQITRNSILTATRGSTRLASSIETAI